uniref:Uncharacterized protein n=1 Tax=Solanum lycopersicum TaxID=4081 RepID=A0A3Q7EES3_SOLLC
MKKVSYASVDGILMYAMVCKRPDISQRKLCLGNLDCKNVLLWMKIFLRKLDYVQERILTAIMEERVTFTGLNELPVRIHGRVRLDGGPLAVCLSKIGVSTPFLQF